MKLALSLVSTAFVVPLAAAAQTSYSHATVIAPAVVAAPAPVVVPSDSCTARQVAIEDAQARLEQDRRDNDTEADAINREAAELAADQRSLDTTDPAAVAAYNARSAAHNRRAAMHNRHAADLNAAAGNLNRDLFDLSASCGVPVVR